MTTKIRELRKKTGLSMKAAAEEFNTPYRTWQDWETGKNRTPGVVIKALKLYLGRLA